jgi:hypothetical protein
MDCIKCGKPAYKVYKPDIDVTGIGMCSEHQEEITLDLMIANFDEKGWEKFENKYLKSDKNERRKKED